MESLFCKTGLENRFNSRMTYWKLFSYKTQEKKSIYTYHRWKKSTFKPQSFRLTAFSCWRSLRFSGSGKCIYLFGGVIEVIWEQWNCLVRECWSLSGSARRSKRKWRVRKRKGLNAVSSIIYCSLSPPLPLSPTLLLLFLPVFKKKPLIMLFCKEC